jgi:hypothetical protein
MNHKSVDKKKIAFFFNVETRISDALISMKEVVGKSLEDLIKKVECMSKEEINLRLIKELIKEDFKDRDELENKAQSILKENETVEFIKSLNISDGAKWNLFCFIENAEAYAKQAMKLINDYAPIYYREIKKEKSHINNAYEQIEKRLVEDQVGFFNTLLRGSFKKESYENIYITVTYLHHYSLYFYEAGNSVFIILGVNHEKYLKKLSGNNEIEKNLILNKKELTREKLQEFIKTIFYKEIIGYKVGIIFIAYEYRSALIKYLRDNSYDMDVVMMMALDHKTISYRSINKKGSALILAEHFGGKGHEEAAGSQIDEKLLSKIIDVITTI